MVDGVDYCKNSVLQNMNVARLSFVCCKPRSPFNIIYLYLTQAFT